MKLLTRDRDRLTPAEEVVLSAVCRAPSGLQKTAAAELGISTRTVETHLQSIRRKLKFDSTADLRIAVARGEITIRQPDRVA